MRIADFDYDLPPDQIAQQPLEDRAAARMLLVDRGRNRFEDSSFVKLPQILQSGDVLVVNNTQVFPARLLGRAETGARVEIFLVEEGPDNVWEALARPARRLTPGKRIEFGEGLWGEVTERRDGGKVRVRLEAPGGDLQHTLDRVGRTPLPPYIKRDAAKADEDRGRYQTVYARERGAIAAPTAGLHFTPEVLEAVQAAGITVVQVTLHVGYGTFEPVRVDDLARHTVTPERYSIEADAADALNAARAGGRRIIAVGTTTTRALESNIADADAFTPGSSWAGLTITPGHTFRAIDGLLTNFHLPQSSLLVLVSAFAGRDLIINAYTHAVKAGYRFYSYGDCMLVL